MFQKDTRHVYRSTALDRLTWLDHGFGTRLSENWVPVRPVTIRQIHSARCVVVDGPVGRQGEGDALLTATRGEYVAVRTADCLPILVADERRRVVAAIHAGWRGTAADIAAAAVATLQARFESRPEDLLVAIGPGICGQCYEVGPEVASQFRKWLPERDDLDRRTRIDLAEINRRQLVAAGVAAARIDAGAPCTCCNPAEFHSHRATPGKAGRMLSAVAILEGTFPWA